MRGINLVLALALTGPGLAGPTRRGFGALVHRQANDTATPPPPPAAASGAPDAPPPPPEIAVRVPQSGSRVSPGSLVSDGQRRFWKNPEEPQSPIVIRQPQEPSRTTVVKK